MSEPGFLLDSRRAGGPEQTTAPDETPLGLLALATDGSVVGANGAWTELSALTREDSMGDGWLGAVALEDRDGLRQRLHAAARAGASGTAGSAEWRLLGPRGRRWSRWWWGPARPQGLLACVADIDEDQAWEFDLWRQVSHGPITQLVAHDQFLALTHWALGHRDRTGTMVAVIVVDVGGSSDGAGAGSRRGTEWRRQAAARMLTAAGPTVTAARVGTDEFAFLCPELRERAQASEIAGKLRQAAGRLTGSEDQPGAATVRITFAAGHDTAETLITSARVATPTGPVR
jgi:GGDEF domain-containing protein